MRLALVRSLMGSALLFATHAATASMSVEESLSAYLDGLRRGDAATLNALFLGEGRFCLNDDKGIRCWPFAEAITNWIKKPDPQATGRIVSHETTADSMARVTYALEFNGMSFHDHMLLYKTGGRWVVVAKTTYIKP